MDCPRTWGIRIGTRTEGRGWLLTHAISRGTSRPRPTSELYADLVEVAVDVRPGPPQPLISVVPKSSRSGVVLVHRCQPKEQKVARITVCRARTKAPGRWSCHHAFWDHPKSTNTSVACPIRFFTLRSSVSPSFRRHSRPFSTRPW